jgi:hypothetical protein
MGANGILELKQCVYVCTRVLFHVAGFVRALRAVKKRLTDSSSRSL